MPGRFSRPSLALTLSDAKHGTAAGDGLLLLGEFQVAVGALSLGLLEFARGGGGVDGVNGQCPVGLETGTQLVLASLPVFSRKSRGVCRACDDAPPVLRRHRAAIADHVTATRNGASSRTRRTLPVCSPVVLESGLLFG